MLGFAVMVFVQYQGDRQVFGVFDDMVTLGKGNSFYNPLHLIWENTL